jgi:regulator of sigma E protease
MTLLAFLLALGILITVHEWGHYRLAVACGVKVLSFSVGFGKPLIQWKAKHPHVNQDTEFFIRLIPLGGYVRMLDESEGHVAPQDVGMAFNRQPLWARVAIVLAGPLANLALAICLFAVTFWMGHNETQPTLSAPVTGSVADDAGIRSGDTVVRMGLSLEEMQDVPSLERLRAWLMQHEHSTVLLEVRNQGKHNDRLLRLSEVPADTALHSPPLDGWQARGFNGAWSRAVLEDVQLGGAANGANLWPGDEVVRINGRQITDAFHLRTMVRESGSSLGPRVQIWDVLRHGQGLLHIEVTPEHVREGQIYVGRIGAQVGEAPSKVWVQYGLFEGAARAFHQTKDIIGLTLDMLQRLVTGRASLDNLSGPLRMADYAGRSASMGIGAYLSYLALVSISLGVFNLLPLPVLDGGHLLYYLYEACTGHPPSAQWSESLKRLGLIVLALLMFFSLFNDVVRLGWLF